MRKWIVFSLVLFSASASSHSWYDNDCCSERDCKAVDAANVVEIEDGWKYLPTGNIFRDTPMLQAIRPSRDRDFHVCISSGGVSRCIYILNGM